MVAGARRPLWLALPSRAAALTRVRAVAAMIALVLLFLLAVLLAKASAASLETSHAALMEALRHDIPFYTALADLARADPADPVVSATPALPRVAMLLGEWGMLVAQALLIAVALWVGAERLFALVRALSGRVAAVALLVAALVAVALLATDAPPLGWSVLLATLAALLWRPARWIEAAALAAAAAVIDPAALPLPVAFALAAAVGRRWHEAAGWAAAILLALAAVAVHRHALQTLVPLPPLGSSDGRVATLLAATFPMLPTALAALMAVVALAGWLGLDDPLAPRIAGTLAIAVVFEGLGRAHPAALAVGLLPLGLLFAPDVLRDLLRAAADRRRITVTFHSRERMVP